MPGHTQLADGFGIDLSQWAIALLRIGAAIAHPIALIGVGRDETRGVDLARLGARLTRGQQ